VTINKSQGQYVGIDLRTPVFSHGQLCGAIDVRNVSILIKESNVDEVTENVVYPEALPS
jgi:hypothetical protein